MYIDEVKHTSVRATGDALCAMLANLRKGRWSKLDRKSKRDRARWLKFLVDGNMNLTYIEKPTTNDPRIIRTGGGLKLESLGKDDTPMDYKTLASNMDAFIDRYLSSSSMRPVGVHSIHGDYGKYETFIYLLPFIKPSILEDNEHKRNDRIDTLLTIPTSDNLANELMSLGVYVVSVDTLGDHTVNVNIKPLPEYVDQFHLYDIFASHNQWIKSMVTHYVTCVVNGNPPSKVNIIRSSGE